MTYFETIRELTKRISIAIVDFATDRNIARTPTQASSNFITNKEQGDWAEKLIINAINTTSKNYVAVKYGKSELSSKDREKILFLYNKIKNNVREYNDNYCVREINEILNRNFMI